METSRLQTDNRNNTQPKLERPKKLACYRCRQIVAQANENGLMVEVTPYRPIRVLVATEQGSAICEPCYEARTQETEASRAGRVRQ